VILISNVKNQKKKIITINTEALRAQRRQKEKNNIKFEVKNLKDKIICHPERSEGSIHIFKWILRHFVPQNDNNYLNRHSSSA